MAIMARSTCRVAPDRFLKQRATVCECVHACVVLYRSLERNTDLSFSTQLKVPHATLLDTNTISPLQPRAHIDPCVDSLIAAAGKLILIRCHSLQQVRTLTRAHNICNAKTLARRARSRRYATNYQVIQPASQPRYVSNACPMQ